MVAPIILLGVRLNLAYELLFRPPVWEDGSFI